LQHGALFTTVCHSVCMHSRGMRSSLASKDQEVPQAGNRCILPLLDAPIAVNTFVHIRNHYTFRSIPPSHGLQNASASPDRSLVRVERKLTPRPFISPDLRQANLRQTSCHMHRSLPPAAREALPSHRGLREVGENGESPSTRPYHLTASWRRARRAAPAVNPNPLARLG